jgi:hypothetical protein
MTIRNMNQLEGNLAEYCIYWRLKVLKNLSALLQPLPNQADPPIAGRLHFDHTTRDYPFAS